jgi:hypothetical protein
LIVNARPLQTGKALGIFQGRATVLLVVSEAATSIKAAYGEMKSLNHINGFAEFDLMISSARSAERAAAIHANLADVANDFLSARLNYLGFIPSGLWLPSPARARGERGQSLRDSYYERVAFALNEQLIPKNNAVLKKEMHHAALC